MERRAAAVIENNATVRSWSERVQKEEGDSLRDTYVSELPDHVLLDVRQNDLRELSEIWSQWNTEIKEGFRQRYGEIAHLLAIRVDESLIRALIQFWNPAYRCFTFNREDMTPTVEEYTDLLHIEFALLDKIYSKEAKPQTFKKKLARLTGMSAQWVENRIRRKGATEGIAWISLKELVQGHPDIEKRVDIFALAIYGLVIFPKTLGYVEAAVIDLFDKLGQKINPAPAILAETFRSLNCCKRKGNGRFIGCTPLLQVWILSHFWKKERFPPRPLMKTCVPIVEFLNREWAKNVTEDQWITTFRNLHAEEITWRAPWILPTEILYKCENHDWVPLLGLWGSIGYAPLMVQRQYDSRQFRPVTHGLNQSEFAYGGEGYMRKVRDITEAWRQPFRVKLAKVSDNLTLDYEVWRSRRVNDKVILPDRENTQPRRELPEIVPSELEIAKQEFELEKAKLNQKITFLQEEKNQLKLDGMMDKAKMQEIERDRDTSRRDLKELHLENQKLHKIIKNNGLGKTTEDWKRELATLKKRIEFWKEKSRKDEGRAVRLFRERQAINEKYTTTTSELAATQSENETLIEQVHDLKSSLQNHQEHIDYLLRSWDEKEKAWQNMLHASEEACQKRDSCIHSSLVQIRAAAERIVDMSEEAKTLSNEIAPTWNHGQRLLDFLEDVKSQGDRARCFL